VTAQQQLKKISLTALANAERLFSARWFYSYGLILLGSLIMAAGYVYFIVPYKIVPGGVYGVGIVLHYLWGVPTGLTGLALNIPLILIGVRVLGPRFGLKTVIGMVLTSGLIDLLTLFWGNKPLVDDALLSAVSGGVLIGAGLGLIFKARATTGGTDIIAQVLNKFTRLPVGQLLIFVDTAIVSLAIIAFHDYTLALYAIVTIYVTGRVLDQLLSGAGYRKAVYIVSEKHEAIRDVIINKLDRGGTYLLGRGMYRGEERQVIFTALSRRELLVLEDQVRQLDPRAFLTILDTREILGEGFSPLSDSSPSS